MYILEYRNTMNKGHVKLSEPLYLSGLYYFSTKIDKFEAYSHQKHKNIPFCKATIFLMK